MSRCAFKKGDKVRVAHRHFPNDWVKVGTAGVVAKGAHGTGKGRICFAGRVNVKLKVRGLRKPVVTPIWAHDLQLIG